MRLRKNLKRTAAAALALSMAISTATPAMAGYKIDMSKVKGDVTITKTGDNDDDVTVSVEGDETGAGIEKTDGTDITITGDNTVDTTEEKDTDENSAPDDVLSTEETEDLTTAVDTMDLTPEDYGQQAADPDEEDGTAEAEEPERSVTETEDGTVIEYGDYDVDPDVQVTKPEAKAETPTPETKTEEKAVDEDDDKDAVTYETNTATKIGKTVAAAARNVIKIINNSTKELKLTLDHLTIDAGETSKDAINVSGTGDVTMELDGDNTLVGGNGDRITRIYAGLNSFGLNNATLTLTDTNEDGKLKANGGNKRTDEEQVGEGIYAKNITLKGVNVTANGGNDTSGYGLGGQGFISYGKTTITDSTLIAQGGDATSDNGAFGGLGLGIANGGSVGLEGALVGDSEISNSHIIATGGKATSKNANGGYGAQFIRGNFKMENVNFCARGGDASGAGGNGGVGLTKQAGHLTASGNIQTIGGNGDEYGGYGYYRIDYDAPSNNGETLTSGQWSIIGASDFNPFVIMAGGESIDGALNPETDEKMVIQEGANLYIFGTGNNEFGDLYKDSITGTTTYYKNAKVTRNDEGDMTITGEPFLLKKAGNDYKVDSKDENTITWKCDTDGVEDVTEKNTSSMTVNDLTHRWKTSADGKYKECTVCHLREDIPQTDPNPGDNTNTTPSDNSNGSDGIAALELRVTDAEGVDMPFAVSQSGAVRTYTANADVATLTGSMETLRYLKDHGAQTITFVTNQQTTSFAIDDLLAQNSSATFYLTHTGADEAQMLVVE